MTAGDGSARVVPVGTGRALGVADVALGAACVLAAPALAREPWLGLTPRAASWVVQALGARQIVQGAVTAARDEPGVLVVGAAVDLVHALTMVPLILVRGPYRRRAASSAALAVLAAGLGAAAAER